MEGQSLSEKAADHRGAPPIGCAAARGAAGGARQVRRCCFRSRDEPLAGGISSSLRRAGPACGRPKVSCSRSLAKLISAVDAGGPGERRRARMCVCVPKELFAAARLQLQLQNHGSRSMSPLEWPRDPCNVPPTTTHTHTHTHISRERARERYRRTSIRTRICVMPLANVLQIDTRGLMLTDARISALMANCCFASPPLNK